jgi:FkbM family methyltransferase
MKLLLKLIYHPTINRLFRPLALLIYGIFGKKLFSVSGILHVKYDTFSFRLHTNQTCSVTQELFYNGAKKYEFTPLFVDLIGKQHVFMDIGANIGYFSVLANAVNPQCKTICFEPSLGALHFLKMNLQENNCTTAVLVEKAVAEIEGTLTFHEVVNKKYPWLKHNLNGSNSLAQQHIKHDHDSYAVQTTTIEKVMIENNLTTLDLIKLDTECTEHLILDCSVDIINEYKPLIISEVYPVIESEIEDIVRTKFIGYKIAQYRTGQNKLIPIQSFKNIKIDDLDRNFVIYPIEKLHLIQEYIN